MTARRKALVRAALVAISITSPLFLAACGGGGNDPSGQVVATVDGEEITKRDLLTEFQASNMQPSEDPKARSAMLERIVQRKLIAAEAVEQKLDKTPEFLAIMERDKEAALVAMLSRRRIAMSPTPSDADAQKFVASNPQMFANRQLLLVNQLQAPSKGLNPKSLEQYTSMDQVTGLFNQQKRKFNTRQTVIDTANIPAEMAAKIMALAPGDLFIVSQGDAVVVNSIAKSEPQPVPEARRLDVAKQMMQRVDEEKVLKSELDTRRKGAKIDYQPGYAPAKDEAKK